MNSFGYSYLFRISYFELRIYNIYSECAIPICKGDFNSDNDVDGPDLALFAADFGRTDCSACP